MDLSFFFIVSVSCQRWSLNTRMRTTADVMEVKRLGTITRGRECVIVGNVWIGKRCEIGDVGWEDNLFLKFCFCCESFVVKACFGVIPNLLRLVWILQSLEKHRNPPFFCLSFIFVLTFYRFTFFSACVIICMLWSRTEQRYLHSRPAPGKSLVCCTVKVKLGCLGELHFGWFCVVILLEFNMCCPIS